MWAEAHPTKIVPRTCENESLARFRENKCQGAEDNTRELVRKFVSAFKVFDRGFETIDKLRGGDVRAALSALYANRRCARARANKTVGSAHGLSRPTRVS